MSLARIIPVIEVPLHLRTRIATPQLNAPWEGVADGASGFHGNAASTAPTLRIGVVPTRVESVAVRDGGGRAATVERREPRGMATALRER